MLLFVCSTSDFIALKTLHNFQFSLKTALKIILGIMKSQVVNPKKPSNSYHPNGPSLYTLQSIALFPFTQMTISKLHKIRSAIYICSSSFSVILLQNFYLLSGAEKNPDNFSDYLSAFNNSVFGCLKAEFSLTVCDDS